MFINLVIFLLALWAVVQGATLATKHAGLLAESYRLSKYTIGFLIVAVLSILPELFISINSSLAGIPSFGMGLLFGGNIADLTLIVFLIIIISRRSLKVESKILKNHTSYPFLLLLPITMGLDGQFSQIEGAVLILIGLFFYYSALKNDTSGDLPMEKVKIRYKSFLLLGLSIALLLAGSHFVVDSSLAITKILNINPLLVGMLVVGLGTTMPELFFSLKAVHKGEDELAIGDLLGTVLADATVVIGFLALLRPFSFPINIIYVTGGFMVIASFLLFYFMRSDRRVTKKEAYVLLGFWVLFVIAELMAGNYH